MFFFVSIKFFSNVILGYCVLLRDPIIFILEYSYVRLVEIDEKKGSHNKIRDTSPHMNK